MSEETSGSVNEQTENNEGRYNVKKLSKIDLLSKEIASHLWPITILHNAHLFIYLFIYFHLMSFTF